MSRELPGELEFLSRLGVLTRPVKPGWVGPGDDAAVIPPVRGKLAFSADVLAQGVHFRLTTASPEEIGFKALAVNVSDMAAMGARPLAATITLTIPKEIPAQWFTRLYEGMAEASERFDCPVVGGDLSAGSLLTISVAIIGECAASPLLRSGARPGDDLWVTGSPGESGAGFALLEAGALREDPIVSHLVARHLKPTPRVGFGVGAATGGLATAAIDVSDGIARDSLNIALRSGAKLVVDSRLLPISGELKVGAALLGRDPVSLALGGGEDYELLLTAPPENAQALLKRASEEGIPLTRIGRVEEGEGREVLGPDGAPLEHFAHGFDHFNGG